MAFIDFEKQAEQCIKIIESLERDLEETAELFEDSDFNQRARAENEKNDFEPTSTTAMFKLAKFRSRDSHKPEFEFHRDLYLKARALIEQAKEVLVVRPIDFFCFADLLYQAMKNNAEAVTRIKTWDIEDEQRSYWSGVTNDMLFYNEGSLKSNIGSANAKKRYDLDSDGTNAATKKAHQEWLRWQQGIVPYHNQTAFIDYARQNFRKADGKSMLSVTHMLRHIKKWKEQTDFKK